MADHEDPPLHEKINQMRTEARVILPGAQALLGFQFIVTMTKTFAELNANIQLVHFIALAAVLLAVVLLIAPAAVHRLGFAGEDTASMHTIGSLLVTAALVPLAIGIAADMYVALANAVSSQAGLLGASLSITPLIGLWYVLPLFIKARDSHQRGQC